MSEHFGNKRAKEFLTLAGADLVEQINSGGRGQPPEYRRAIAQGSEVGAEKRFFHWDLEFPEAFVDLGLSTWKRKDDQGFDAVVGNPPYDELSEHASGRVLRMRRKGLSIQGTATHMQTLQAADLTCSEPFILRSESLLVTRGFHSFIVPMALLGDSFTARLRKRLLNSGKLRSVASIPPKGRSPKPHLR